MLKRLWKISVNLVQRCLPRMSDNKIVNGDVSCVKRILPVDATEESDAKQARMEMGQRKRMSALLMMYSGVGYFGMQRNLGFKTIEGDLLDALLKAGAIVDSQHAMPGRIRFQRASKTDKSVSAAGQVCSLKLPIEDVDLVKKINAELPEQIRVLDVIRTTKSFNAKGQCEFRTYQYLSPTFAFAPRDIPDEKLPEFRISPETVQQINTVLQMYKGTKNYHNFTSGRKPQDPSCKRYMIHLSCGDPFIHGDMEFVTITIRGQSFMLHQIRKMIGLAMALIRGFTDDKVIDLVFGLTRIDIPKAPGLGLLLDQVNYSSYNRRMGGDGVHTSIEWENYKDEIERFKHAHIFPYMFKVEKEEKSMLNWLETMGLHSYSHRECGPNDKRSEVTTAPPIVLANEEQSVASLAQSDSEQCDTTTNQNQAVDSSENVDLAKNSDGVVSEEMRDKCGPIADIK